MSIKYLMHKRKQTSQNSIEKSLAQAVAVFLHYQTVVKTRLVS